MTRPPAVRRTGWIGILTALLMALAVCLTAPLASADVPSTCAQAFNRDGHQVAEVCVNPKYTRIHVTDTWPDGTPAVGYWSTESTPYPGGYNDKCVDSTGANTPTNHETSSAFCGLAYDQHYGGNPGDKVYLTAGDRVCFRAANLAGSTAYYLSDRKCVTFTGSSPGPGY